MKLTPKEVKCDCGESMTLEMNKVWCAECGRPVFYNPKDRRNHKFHNLYVLTLMISVFAFLTYVFLELIVTPLQQL